MFYKVTVVQGKKSSSMMFSIIIAMTLALATVTTITTTTTTAAVSSTSISSQSNQNASSSIQQINQPPYNATQNMISAFKTADSLLMQALNNLNTGKTQGALTQLNMAKMQIEQYQLAALDAQISMLLLELTFALFLIRRAICLLVLWCFSFLISGMLLYPPRSSLSVINSMLCLYYQQQT